MSVYCEAETEILNDLEIHGTIAEYRDRTNRACLRFCTNCPIHKQFHAQSHITRSPQNIDLKMSSQTPPIKVYQNFVTRQPSEYRTAHNPTEHIRSSEAYSRPSITSTSSLRKTSVLPPAYLYQKDERYSTGIFRIINVLFLIIIINIQGWAIWPVPSPELQLLSPSLLRSPNCSLSLRAVEV